MNSRGIPAPDDQDAGSAVLTIYARSHVFVCSRVLQALALRQITVERFVADLSRFDHREVRGLNRADGPVMRLSVVVSHDGVHELNQLNKFLNRIIDVYKVEHTSRV